jgi:hypothetical protein
MLHMEDVNAQDRNEEKKDNIKLKYAFVLLSWLNWPTIESDCGLWCYRVVYQWQKVVSLLGIWRNIKSKFQNKLSTMA